MDTHLTPLAMLATLFNYGSNWNLILFIIIGCSIVSFTIFIERLMQLYRCEINTNQFIIAMRKTIKEGNLIEAIQICERTSGTIAAIVKAGILKHNRGKEQIESAMETAGLIEIARLEKNAKNLINYCPYCPSHWIAWNCPRFHSSFC